MYEEFVKEFKIIELSEFEKDSELLKNINLVKIALNNMHKKIEFEEGELIDYYAYKIKAEEAKYGYLIKKTKKRKLNIIK